MGSISDTKEIVKASWSLFQHHGADAFKLSERSPLQPPLSAKNLPGGRTQILNVRRIRRINRHPVESDEDSAPESISVTEDFLNWNWDLDNPNHSEDNCAADVESDMEQDNSIENPQSPEQQDVRASAKCSRIDSTYTEVKETGCKDVGEGLCNRNEKEPESEEKVGHNASMFHELLDVSWPSVLVRDILWANAEQKLVNIGWQTDV